jgi:long-subunit fatty acid transport protein
LHTLCAFYFRDKADVLPKKEKLLIFAFFSIFSGNQIDGELPESLKIATTLRIFHGANNQLSGSIPAAWTTFSSMTQFDVSSNKLSGGIPEEFFNGLPATSLTVL